MDPITVYLILLRTALASRCELCDSQTQGRAAAFFKNKESVLAITRMV